MRKRPENSWRQANRVSVTTTRRAISGVLRLDDEFTSERALAARIGLCGPRKSSVSSTIFPWREREGSCSEDLDTYLDYQLFELFVVKFVEAVSGHASEWVLLSLVRVVYMEV